MADDQDVPAEITPEDFDGKQDIKAESSPEDKKPEVVEKPKEEAKEAKREPETDKAEPEGKETESDPDKPEAETEEADKPTTEKPTKADERKTQLNTEIRDLVAQRNALKEEVTKANSEAYQPATEQELTDEGMSATEAKIEALRQSIELRDYNEKVADAQLTIESEANRVLNDFPIFNPDSEDYDQELSNEAAQLLQANLIVDPNTNQVIGSNVMPYALYKTFARASGISTTKGQLKGQQAAESMLANADVSTGTAPAKKPADPLADLWKDDL